MKAAAKGITQEILDRASKRVGDLGIELIDARFKRINYVEEVQKDVFVRMIAERKHIAERFRSEGEGEAARKRIQSDAYTVRLRRWVAKRTEKRLLF